MRHFTFASMSLLAVYPLSGWAQTQLPHERRVPSDLAVSIAGEKPVTLRLSGQPRGALTLFDGIAMLGHATLNQSGEATFSLPSLRPGRHTVYALSGGHRSRPVTVNVPALPFPAYDLPQHYDAPVNGTRIVAADFNGDGHLDLALAGARGLAVLPGNGDGTFGAAQTTRWDGKPAGLVAADFNGDGIPDLAISDPTVGIRILLGAGDGTFVAAQPVAGLAEPAALAAADFNGDGVADLAALDVAGNAVYLMAGNGDGTFAAPVKIASVSNPTALAVGDFNHDGIADVAVTASATNTASVWLGAGDGTFGAPISLPAGTAPSAIVAADVDGDGIDDLAVLSASDSAIQLFYSNGDGTFREPLQFPGGAFPGALAAGDPESKGYRTLIVADGGTVRMRRLNSTGLWSTNSFDAAASINALATGDFAGDGRLWVAMAASDAVSVLRPHDGLDPVLTKGFSPNPVAPGSISVLTFSVSGVGVAASSVAFSDTLPSGMTIATPNGLAQSGGCGFTVTATSGSGSITVSNGTVSASGTCSISMGVTASNIGTYNNTTTAITSSQGTGNTASASLLVANPITASKNFNPSGMQPNGTSTVTINITNPTSNPTIHNVSFTDNLPSNLVISTPNGLTNTCGGTATASAGSGIITLTGSTLNPSSSCFVTANVTATPTGTYTNPSFTVSSTEGVTGTVAAATLNVAYPPTISKLFLPTSIQVGQTTLVSFTITNPNGNSSPPNHDVNLTGLSFTDSLPAQLQVANPNNASNSCGGTLTAVPGSSSITLSGGTLSAASGEFNGQCFISLSVTGISPGTASNTTGPISANESGPGSISNTATLTISAAPLVLAPTLNKAFGAQAIPLNGTTSLTFNLANPNAPDNIADTTNFTNVTVIDNLPSGLVVANPSGFSTTCNDSAIANPGSTSIQLVAQTMPASSSCIFTVNVTGTTGGVKNNTTQQITAIHDDSGGNPVLITGGTASATLTVVAPPTITTSFNPLYFNPGGTSLLTITLQNPNSTTALTGVSISDILPPALVATGGAVTNTCGATVTAVSITLTGGSLAAGASCTVSVNVTASTAAVYTNTVNASSTNGGTSTAASATVTVTIPPAVFKGFLAPTVPLNGSVAVSFDITNQSTNVVTLTGISFTDSLPSGLVVSTPNGLTNSCGGAVTATPGSSSISLSGASLAIGAKCTIRVNVTGTTVGAKNNSVTVTSNEGGSSVTATATLVVVGPPVISKSFGAGSIAAGTSTTLTFTIANPTANTVALTGVAFSDVFPANLAIATPNALANTCSGTAVAPAGSGTVSLTGGSVGVGSSCTVTVNVTSTVAGNYTNTSGAIASSNGGTGNTATAALTVNSAAATMFTITAPSTATAGTPFGFTVRAFDSFGNAATSYTGPIIFFSTDAKATLPGKSALTNGVGTFSATLGTPGARTITATDDAVSTIAGTSGNVTVSVGPPFTIVIVSGNNQTALLNGTFANALTVSVLDAYGNPIPGLTVTFSAPATGASATFFSGSRGVNLLSASLLGKPARPKTTLPRPNVTGPTGAAITDSSGVASIGATANNLAGTYSITASVGAVTGQFTMTNVFPTPPVLNPQLNPAFLTLRYNQTPGTPAPPVTGTVGITTAVPSSYTTVITVPWLSVTPASGSTGGSVTVLGNGSALQPGIYSANVLFTFGDGSTVILPVQLYVTGPPQFKTVSGLAFTAQAGSTSVQTQSTSIQSTGADFAVSLSIADVSGGGGSWLSATPTSFSTPGVVQVSANPSGLAVGVYQKSLVATSSAAGNSPLTIPVTLTITAAPPAISVSSIVNAASFATGPMAPNTIVTAFGTFPGCSANAQATVDGNATTVVYSSTTQISLLIPGSVAGESAAQLQIACAGLTGPVTGVPIAAVSPALFTVSQDGTGQAAVVNQDGSIDKPSPAGTVIELYGTGFGAYGLPGSDGLMRMAQTVTATIGGAAAQVLYAGQAPGNTLGLQQINVLIPANTASGTQPLQLTIGGAATQSALTVTIR